MTGTASRPRGTGHAVALALTLCLPQVALAQSPGDGCRVVVDYEEAAIGEFPAG